MKYQNDGYHDASGVSAFKKLAWVLGGLLAIAFFVAVHYGVKSKKLEQERSTMTMSMEELDAQKVSLEGELINLDSSYQLQISENQELTVTLEERVKEVEDLKARVWTAKQKLAKSEEANAAINEKLAQLEELKTGLEGDIVALKETNLELIDANTQMAADLQVSKAEAVALNEKLAEVSERNEKLVQRLYTVAPAGFVAKNFAVTAQRRNNKLTAKAKQAEMINVSFDVNDVPKEFQKDEEIYLVLTTFDGNPVDVVQGKEVQVKSNEPIAIKAVDVEQTTLSDRQNIAMSFDAARDLESGMYNLLVYADHGFLGATTFQLQ